jgi:hypothetical protein
VSASSAAPNLVPLDPRNPWLEWLRQHVDTTWRPGQWVQEAWLFTGFPEDPTTTVGVCHVQTCETLVGSRRLCKLCRRAFRRSGQSFDEFIVDHAPVRQKRHPAEFRMRPQCLAERESRCPRTDHFSGLCVYHYYGWRRALSRDPAMVLEKWLSEGNITIPSTRLPECRVPACDRESAGAKMKLCTYHQHQWRRSGSGQSVEDWARGQIGQVQGRGV